MGLLYSKFKFAPSSLAPISNESNFLCNKKLTHVSEGLRKTVWWSEWLNSFLPTVRTASLSSFVYCNFVYSLFLLFCIRFVANPSVNFYKNTLKLRWTNSLLPHFTFMTPSVSVRKLKSPKRKYGTFPCASLWNFCRVCSRALRLFLQYTEGYVSIATKLEASWNRWILTRSKTVPCTDHRVLKKPFLDHLH